MLIKQHRMINHSLMSLGEENLRKIKLFEKFVIYQEI